MTDSLPKPSQSNIVFIRMWPKPPIAASVEAMLRQAFPEYELEVVDVVPLLKRKPLLMLLNSLAVLREYGWQILRRQKTFKDSFYRTSFLFKRVKPLVADRLECPQVAFSFQLQSMFDASQPHLPHFLYTDHTHLANLSYPGFKREDLFSPTWIELEKSAYCNASRVFTRSTNISQSLIEQYGCPPEKVACVYAGSNTAASPGEEQRSSGLTGKDILFVGIDWERKGGPELVQAFEQVLKVHPDASLTIIGCNPDISLPNVRVMGKLPVNALPAYYQQAAIFCLPTRLEPFGIVFVEALSYGLPVVATRVGAVPDFVIENENGCLVNPGDANGLAQALIDLLNSPDKRVRFGEASRQLSESRYNWQAVAKAVRAHVLKSLPEP